MTGYDLFALLAIVVFFCLAVYRFYLAPHKRMW